jgi:hypothetical protein
MKSWGAPVILSVTSSSSAVGFTRLIQAPDSMLSGSISWSLSSKVLVILSIGVSSPLFFEFLRVPGCAVMHMPGRVIKKMPSCCVRQLKILKFNGSEGMKRRKICRNSTPGSAGCL